jgi:hypothetical protein
MIKNFCRWVLSFSLVFLYGCEWITPVDAEQTFEVIKGRDIRVNYSGIFANYCSENIALMSYDRVPQADDVLAPQGCSERLTTTLENVFSGSKVIGSVQAINLGQHKIEYQAEFERVKTKIDEDLICLRDGVGCEKLRIGTFADIRAGEKSFELFGNEDAYRELNSILNLKNDGKPEALYKLFQNFGKKAALTRMRLVVKTDMYVMSHNASSVTPLLNGVKEYRWELLATSPRPSLKAVDDETHGKRLVLKENLSTPGRLCREFINGPCYCGPFKLVGENGKPFKNQPYEMMAGGKTFDGVTGDDGSIKAVATETTGQCGVRLKNQER